MYWQDDMHKEIKLYQDQYYLIRQDMLEALERYLNHGLEPGGFLMSALSNDLYGACTRADYDNKQNIPNIIGYIYHHLPSDSWGSREIVKSYILKIRAEKENNKTGEIL